MYIVIEDTKSNIINAADGTRGMKIEHLLLDTSDFKNEIFAGANGGGAVNKIVPYTNVHVCMQLIKVNNYFLQKSADLKRKIKKNVS